MECSNKEGLEEFDLRLCDERDIKLSALEVELYDLSCKVGTLARSFIVLGLCWIAAVLLLLFHLLA